MIAHISVMANEVLKFHLLIETYDFLMGNIWISLFFVYIWISLIDMHIVAVKY